MKYKIDINKPGVPIGILHSKLSDFIIDECKLWRIPIHDDLKKFTTEINPNDWDEWEQELLRLSDEMSNELLESWTKVLYSGFLRGTLIKILKNRKEKT